MHRSTNGRANEPYKTTMDGIDFTLLNDVFAAMTLFQGI